MQSQVVTQPVTVTSLSGNVVVVNAQGQARIVNAGDVLQPDEIIITVNQSAIELQTTQGGVQIDENCVACLPEFSADGQPEVQAAPVQGQINLDLAQLDTANFDEQSYRGDSAGDFRRCRPNHRIRSRRGRRWCGWLG